MLKKIKSPYILKNISKYINEKLLLKLIIHNKSLQNKLDININTYKYYNQIEILLIPELIKEKNVFINIHNKNEFCHIYFIITK